MLDPFDDDFYPDKINIYALPATVDGENTPDLNAPGTKLHDSFVCAVQKVTTTSIGLHREDTVAPFGVAQYEIPCPSDPSVTSADQLLEWTDNVDGPLSPTIWLRTLGAAKPPGGS